MKWFQNSENLVFEDRQHFFLVKRMVLNSVLSVPSDYVIVAKVPAMRCGNHTSMDSLIIERFSIVSDHQAPMNQVLTDDLSWAFLREKKRGGGGEGKITIVKKSHTLNWYEKRNTYKTSSSFTPASASSSMHPISLLSRCLFKVLNRGKIEKEKEKEKEK